MTMWLVQNLLLKIFFLHNINFGRGSSKVSHMIKHQATDQYKGSNNVAVCAYNFSGMLNSGIILF
jgi:hypothetical protein